MELLGLAFRQPWWLIVGLAVSAVVAGLYLWALKSQGENALRHAKASQLAKLGLEQPMWLKLHGWFLAMVLAIMFFSGVLAQPHTVELEAASERADIAFAIDGSASMQAIEPGCGVRFECAKQLLVEALEAIPDGDTTSLMSFADGAAVLIPPTLDREVIRHTLERLEPQGSTDLAAVIQATLDTTTQTEARHLVIISDGNIEANSVNQVMLDAANAGLHVSTVLVGSPSGYLPRGDQRQGAPVFPLNMQTIAQTGSGEYAEGSVPEISELLSSLERETVYERREVSWPYFGFIAGLMLLLGLAGLFWRFSRSVGTGGVYPQTN